MHLLDLPNLVGALAGFFAIMNPIANAPIFMGLTRSMGPDVRKRVAIRAVAGAFLLTLAFMLAGNALFRLFGITLTAFRLTGGVLVFMVGYSALHGSPSSMHQGPGEEEHDSQADMSVAMTPLATPILAGPGTIATAMGFVGDGDLSHLLATIAAFGLMCLVTLLGFLGAEGIQRVLGLRGVDLVARLMGLILAVVGTQMLIGGLTDVALDVAQAIRAASPG